MKSEVSLGCDPEFLILAKGSTASNATVLPADHYFNGSMEAAVGHDGHSSTGELRPKPADSAAELVANIRPLIQEIYKTVRKDAKFGLVSAGNGVRDPIGGHIHFGYVDEPSEFTKQCLDLFFSIPLALIEQDPYNKKRRTGDGYGQLATTNSSGIRIQSAYGFEYRPPASWLVSKDIALSALSLAHWVCEQSYMKGSPAYKAMQVGVGKITDWNNLNSKFKNADKTYLKQIYDSHIKGVIDLAPDEVKANTKTLRGMIDRRESWNEWQDLSVGWGLSFNGAVEIQPFNFAHRVFGLRSIEAQVNTPLMVNEAFKPINIVGVSDSNAKRDDYTGAMLVSSNLAAGGEKSDLFKSFASSFEDADLEEDPLLPENTISIAEHIRYNEKSRACLAEFLTKYRASMKAAVELNGAGKPKKVRASRHAACGNA